MRPKIYTLHCSNPGGYLGESSLKVVQPNCATCGKPINEHIKFTAIEFVIENYNNEDILCPSGALIITESLLNKLLFEKLNGFAPIKINVLKSEYYRGTDELPKLYYLAVLNSKIINIPIAYDYTEQCFECKGFLLKFNPDKLQHMFRENHENQLQLQVYYDSWKDEDIFGFLDHPEFGITERFYNILKNFNCPDTTIIEALWV